jgi:hypothetical protein
MLKNRTMKRFIENSINRIAEIMKKSVQMNNDSGQLFTSFESSFSQYLFSHHQIISLRFELIENDKMSRLQSFDAEDAAESSNVIVRRKNKEKKSIEFDQLLAIDQTSLNVTKIQIDLKEIRSSKNIKSVDLNEANILKEKRARKLTNKYVQIV